jgi:hypothetical protein
MISKGSRVRVISSARSNLTGTVTEVHQEAWMLVPFEFTVRFDDTNLMPSEMRYSFVDLEIIEEPSMYGSHSQPFECWCGTRIAMGKDDDPQFHNTDYCPVGIRYKKRREFL